MKRSSFLAVPCLGLTIALAAADLGEPLHITSVALDAESDLVVRATAPAGGGFGYAALEAIGAPASGSWEIMLAAPVENDQPASLRFTMPIDDRFALVRVRLGAIGETLPIARFSAEGRFEVIYGDPSDPGSGSGGDPGSGSGGDPGKGGFPPRTPTEKIGHVLNRLTYGPTPEAFEKVQGLGIAAYIEEQLQPETIDETGNVRLTTKIAPFYLKTSPGERTYLIEDGAEWHFFRGTREPPGNWRELNFSEIFWETGRTGIGYGDDDDRTVLEDMRGENGYLSLYARRKFQLEGDISTLGSLILRLKYDDAFVAYLNGQEIARANIVGTPPAHDQAALESAGNVDDDDAETEFSVAGFERWLRPGENVLAVQVHNAGRGSSDLSFTPELYHAPPPAYPAIRSLDALQQLVHLQGLYSERQLQAVLGDFWENHFTTDYHKLTDYLEEVEAYARLMTSGAEEDRLEDQIEEEAAQMEFQEYLFFRDHALGHFGDLLLYSATSPAMLIYLDNVLNVKDEPNENYAREILELYAFGVDNRYSQTDIEALARCFTGWTVRKVRPELIKPFPEAARTPYLTPSLTIEDEREILGLGASWRYFKGLREPSPDADGNPTIAWTEPGFADGSWMTGPSGLGYGDGDDATVLTDMRDGYLTVYARHEFVLDPEQPVDELVMDVRYDDGYVAYLNGEEIGRSQTMRGYGTPPPFDRSSRGHEADDGNDAILLGAYRHLLRPAPETNVVAFQVHNREIDSSDLSLAPRIVARTYTADSIDEASPAGLWTFRFDPGQHDLGEKVFFQGTPNELRISAGRDGVDGVLDAIEVIDAMANHPSTREFVVVKLVNKFISDAITLESYQNGSAPPELIAVVNEGVEAWQSTARPGHVGTVLRALLDPERQAGAFWSGRAYRSKIKSALEFVNSSLRALDAEVINSRLPEVNEDLGMTLFEREEPDGFPEAGDGWMDTQSLLERIKFVQALSGGLPRSGASWDPLPYLQPHRLVSPDQVIGHFDTYFFQGHLHADQRSILLEFTNTDDACRPSPWAFQSAGEKRRRLRELTALLLASPEFQLQ